MKLKRIMSLRIFSRKNGGERRKKCFALLRTAAAKPALCFEGRHPSLGAYFAEGRRPSVAQAASAFYSFALLRTAAAKPALCFEGRHPSLGAYFAEGRRPSVAQAASAFYSSALLRTAAAKPALCFEGRHPSLGAYFADGRRPSVAQAASAPSEGWRRGRDLNPRYPFGVHGISSAAPSAARSPLRNGPLRRRPRTVCKVGRVGEKGPVSPALLAPIFELAARGGGE
jgi:hypothetical protein